MSCCNYGGIDNDMILQRYHKPLCIIALCAQDPCNEMLDPSVCACELHP